MNKKKLLVVGIIFLAIVGFLSLRAGVQKEKIDFQNPSKNLTTNSTSKADNQFRNPKKSAHYESNTPDHGVVLAGVPINVVIDFNFDVSEGSAISITSNNNEYGVGETIIDSNPLALRRNMDTNAPDGVYTVLYKACWADGSCHDGNFQFAIDRSKASDFVDMTDKNEVTVHLKNTSFNPQNLKIRSGTKITWINEDDFVHTVNTNPHPAHTYFTNQNSRNLEKGDSYAVTFDKPGIYPYHCTPHADFMNGSILVE